MRKSIVDKLKKDSSFYDNDCYFKYTVSKVYKYNNRVNGVQVYYTWKNIFGSFSEIKYISRKELLSKCYDDEFVEI